MKRQGNKPEKSYIELTPGTPVWVQHRQNATWEPAIVINQIAESLCTDGTALEIPEDNEGSTPYTPGSHKSTRKNFGKPASSFSDFYM